MVNATYNDPAKETQLHDKPEMRLSVPLDSGVVNQFSGSEGVKYG